MLDCHGVGRAACGERGAWRVTEPGEQLQVAARRARPGRGGAATLGSDNLCHMFLFYARDLGPSPQCGRSDGAAGARPRRPRVRVGAWGPAFCAGTTGLAKPAGERRVASRTETHRRCDQHRPKRRGTPCKTSLLAGPCARLVRALCPVRSCLRSCTPLHHAS